MQPRAHHAAVPRPPRKPSDTDETMAVGFRLPTDLVRALDAEAEAMSPAGIRLSRTDALRVLLTEAIAARHKGRKSK